MTTASITEPTTREADTSALDPACLFATLSSEVDSALEQMGWADDEIAAAAARHPDSADLLYHAFGLLLPRDIGPGMGTEFVYRGHVRELLDRIAAGQCTRAGTAAEICLALSQVSQVAPMRAFGNGLYFRMWLQAFPGQQLFDDQAAQQIHYESLHGSAIDDAEAMMRTKLADPHRRLGDVECQARHHGMPAACRYAATSPADLTP